MEDSNLPLLNFPAHLWDGYKQLSGTISLTTENLVFRFDDFQKSHLNLKIPIEDIENAESFLLFDISRKGLKISAKNGHEDLFILDDPMGFLKELTKLIGR